MGQRNKTTKQFCDLERNNGMMKISCKSIAGKVGSLR